MDYSKAFAISASGMALERTRVEVAASNLAHANTVQHAGGSSYEPMRVLARTVNVQPFSELVEGGAATSQFAAFTIEPQGAAVRSVHEPGHPLANAKGFVNYPGVDPALEMVTLMSAMRSYEANLAALNTARALALRTLEIGRGT